MFPSIKIHVSLSKAISTTLMDNKRIVLGILTEQILSEKLYHKFLSTPRVSAALRI